MAMPRFHPTTWGPSTKRRSRYWLKKFWRAARRPFRLASGNTAFSFPLTQILPCVIVNDKGRYHSRYRRVRAGMTGAVTNVVSGSATLPALFAPDASAGKRFVEFFTANIRNPNTRKAYARAASEFASWCDRNGLTELRDIEPVHVAAYIEGLQVRLAAPSV